MMVHARLHQCLRLHLCALGRVGCLLVCHGGVVVVTERACLLHDCLVAWLVVTLLATKALGSLVRWRAH
jgi:hypothetical protein